MKENNKTLVVGKIGAVYGIKGWVKVHSFTDDSETIFDYAPWSLKIGDKLQSATVTEWRRHNNGLIARLNDVMDRDIAQTFVSAEILVDSSNLPELPEGEFYWKDLIGMKAVTTKGYDLGIVSDILETGSNDVLIVKANTKDGFGKNERLIPFIEDQVIMNVDLVNKQIDVDWDPGF